LLGDEATPRLHEPAVVDVLRAAERLARPGAELALEEVAEGLLEDVADLREVTLADAADLDLGQAPLRIEPGAIDGGPHAEEPASPPASAVRVRSRSSPAFFASVSASASAVRFPATMIWLASFVNPPNPSGPRCVIVRPIALKIGSTASKTALSPPTMIESVASIAPFSPPDTGASSIVTPLAARA